MSDPSAETNPPPAEPNVPEASTTPVAHVITGKPVTRKPVTQNPYPGGYGRQNETISPDVETTTAFAPLGVDQSYVWMMQLVILVATMTLFLPMLRKLFGIKPKKRQVVNYSSYDFDNCDNSDDDDNDDGCAENEECCDEE